MKRTLLIFILLNLPFAAVAAGESLYSGRVAVPSQSEADRAEAIPGAFIQVLQKLSGKREMPVSPVLDQAIEDAEKFLISFRYVNMDRTGPDGNVETGLNLVANFMRAAVDRIVREAGLPRWQQERPAVQLWVMIDDGGNRQLKPVEYSYAWEAMEDVASMRGLPVSWPDLDDEEMQLIDTRLVWGGFTDYLVEHGAPADGVAIVAARREGFEWTVRWNVASGEQHWSWRNADQELRFALVQGIHQMTDRIASANTIAAVDQGSWSVDITVAELSDAKAYAACLDYLQSLDLVTAVEVLGADPGQVHFRLQLNASPEYLSNALNRGTVLLRSSAGNEFDYEFLQP